MSASYSITTEAVDTGGGHQTSLSYTGDTCDGLDVGIATASSTSEISKIGYVAQLYETIGLQVNAVSPTELTAWMVLDDSSVILLPSMVSGFSASGLALLPIQLGFNPTSRDVLTLVNNTTTGPILGVFVGRPQGSTVSASFEGNTYDFTLSYVGGTGNDITLALPQPVPTSLFMEGSTQFRSGTSNRKK